MRNATQEQIVIDAATAYGTHVAMLRYEHGLKLDDLIGRWLESDMSIVERDRRQAAIDAWLTKNIEEERALYRYKRDVIAIAA